MSLTVRYPNGQEVTYNRANQVRYNGNAWELYERTSQGQNRWVASVQASAGAIIEQEPPCDIANPLLGMTADAAITYVLDHLDAINADDLAELKRRLSHFDARRGCWMFRQPTDSPRALTP